MTCTKCNCPSASDEKCSCCGEAFTAKQRVLDAIARGKQKHELEQQLKREALEAEIRRKREIVEGKKLAAKLWVEQTLPALIESAAATGLTRFQVDTDLPDDGDETPYRANACREAGLEVTNVYYPRMGDGYSQETPAHHVYYVSW